MLYIGKTNDTFKSSTTMHPYFSRFVASTLYQAHQKKRGRGEKKERQKACSDIARLTLAKKPPCFGVTFK